MNGDDVTNGNVTGPATTDEDVDTPAVTDDDVDVDDGSTDVDVDTTVVVVVGGNVVVVELVDVVPAAGFDVTTGGVNGDGPTSSTGSA